MSLELTQIPAGVLTEINERFDAVSIELDSNITEDTKPYKLKYIEVGDELITTSITNAETLETHEVVGHSAKCFLAQIDVLEDACIIRRVLSMGNVLVPHKENGE